MLDLDYDIEEFLDHRDEYPEEQIQDIKEQLISEMDSNWFEVTVTEDSDIEDVVHEYLEYKDELEAAEEAMNPNDDSDFWENRK